MSVPKLEYRPPRTVPLWSHQKAAIERARNKFALLFDPGCGKTRTAFEILKKQIAAKGGLQFKTIIFAPLNVCRNWRAEAELYFDKPYRMFLVSGGTPAKKLKELEAFRDCKDKKHLFCVVNIESLRSDKFLTPLIESKPTAVIADESHNFKGYKSKQTLGLLDLMETAKPEFLYLLTGTPAPQGEIDLWSTFYLLGETDDNFFVWRKKNFEDKNEKWRGKPQYFPKYIIWPEARIRMQEQLSRCSITARKDSVLDLPPLLRTNLYAEMSPEQSRHYETMREFLFAVDSEGHELNAANLLSRTLRLQQILAGFLGDVPIKDNPRIAALKDAIAKTEGQDGKGEQFLVWTIFKSTYRQVADVLDEAGIKYGLLTGEQTAEERHEAMVSFQAGELRALIAHPKAGGVGVNLTAASYSIHYTRSFSLTDDLQAEARNYRGGSERHRSITRIDIITPDTIDEEISTALREKKSIQDFILGLKEQHGIAK